MPMKFRAHDTFFIRKGWLSKGMRCVHNKPDLFVDKEENPMDVLGIGTNMVKALRYWLQAVGLTEEPSKGKRTQSFTPLGQLIFDHDTYIEELGTLHLLQYRLASQAEEATAWYYFFNEFSMSEFSREDFVEGLQKYIKMNESDSDVAIRQSNGYGLTHVVLPSMLSEIGKEAFKFCDQLRMIEFPSSLKRICESAFYACKGLSELSLPEGLEAIESTAFKMCDNILKLHIPDSITWNCLYCMDGFVLCMDTEHSDESGGTGVGR